MDLSMQFKEPTALSCQKISYFKKLTDFANERVLLPAIGNLNVAESERRALGEVVDVVHPDAFPELEPLVLALDKVVQGSVVAAHVRHRGVVRLKH